MIFKTIFFIAFFFCLFTTFGQQKVRGRVISEDLGIGMGITIFDKDTTEVGKTNFDGYFEIELQKNYEKLIFVLQDQSEKDRAQQKIRNLPVL